MKMLCKATKLWLEELENEDDELLQELELELEKEDDDDELELEKEELELEKDELLQELELEHDERELLELEGAHTKNWIFVKVSHGESSLSISLP